MFIPGAGNRNPNCVACTSLGGSLLLAYASAGSVAILSWELKVLQVLNVYNKEEVTCVQWCDDDGQLAVGTQSAVVIYEPRIKRQRSRTTARELPEVSLVWTMLYILPHDYVPRSLSWGPYGHHLLVCGSSLFLWEFPVLEGPSTTAAEALMNLSREGEDESPALLASTPTFISSSSYPTPPRTPSPTPASAKHPVVIWSMLMANAVLYSSFAPPPAFMFATSGEHDRCIKVWYRDSATSPPGSPLRFSFVYLAHERAVTAIEWRKPILESGLPVSFDHNTLLTSCRDNIICLWSTAGSTGIGPASAPPVSSAAATGGEADTAAANSSTASANHDATITMVTATPRFVMSNMVQSSCLVAVGWLHYDPPPPLLANAQTADDEISDVVEITVGTEPTTEKDSKKGAVPKHVVKIHHHILPGSSTASTTSTAADHHYHSSNQPLTKLLKKWTLNLILHATHANPLTTVPVSSGSMPSETVGATFIKGPKRRDWIVGIKEDQSVTIWRVKGINDSSPSLSLYAKYSPLPSFSSMPIKVFAFCQTFSDNRRRRPMDVDVYAYSEHGWTSHWCLSVHDKSRPPSPRADIAAIDMSPPSTPGVAGCEVTAVLASRCFGHDTPIRQLTAHPTLPVMASIDQSERAIAWKPKESLVSHRSMVLTDEFVIDQCRALAWVPRRHRLFVAHGNASGRGIVAYGFKFSEHAAVPLGVLKDTDDPSGPFRECEFAQLCCVVPRGGLRDAGDFASVKDREAVVVAVVNSGDRIVAWRVSDADPARSEPTPVNLSAAVPGAVAMPTPTGRVPTVTADSESPPSPSKYARRLKRHRTASLLGMAAPIESELLGGPAGAALPTNGRVRCVCAVNPNAHYAPVATPYDFVTGGEDGVIRFWKFDVDTASGMAVSAPPRQVAAFTAHNRPISEIKIAYFGQLASLAEGESHISIWEIESVDPSAGIGVFRREARVAVATGGLTASHGHKPSAAPHFDWVPLGDGEYALVAGKGNTVQVFVRHSLSTLGFRTDWTALPEFSVELMPPAPSTTSGTVSPTHAAMSTLPMSTSGRGRPPPIRGVCCVHGSAGGFVVSALRNQLSVLSPNAPWNKLHLHALKDIMLKRARRRRRSLRGLSEEQSTLSQSAAAAGGARALPPHHPKVLRELCGHGRVDMVDNTLRHLYDSLKAHAASGGGAVVRVPWGPVEDFTEFRRNVMPRAAVHSGTARDLFAEFMPSTMSTPAASESPPSMALSEAALQELSKMLSNFQLVDMLPSDQLMLVAIVDSLAIAKARNLRSTFDEAAQRYWLAERVVTLLEAANTSTTSTPKQPTSAVPRMHSTVTEAAMTVSTSPTLRSSLGPAMASTLAARALNLMGTPRSTSGSVLVAGANAVSTPSPLSSTSLHMLVPSASTPSLAADTPWSVPASPMSTLSTSTNMPAATFEPFQLNTADYVWALLSKSQDALVGVVCAHAAEPGSGGDSLTWGQLRTKGIGLWLADTTALKTLLDRVAKARFVKTKNPLDAALFYVAIGRRAALLALCKATKNTKLVEFLGRNFSEERTRTAALKNAYTFLGQHRYELAVTFFLLGGELVSAVAVCLKNLQDFQLAIALCRLWGEGDSVAAMQKEAAVKHRVDILRDTVVKGYLVPLALATADPFLEVSAWALVGEWDNAVAALKKTATVESTSTSPFFHPALLLLFQHLLHHMKLLKRVDNVDNVDEARPLVRRTAHTYLHTSCGLVALPLLVELYRNHHAASAPSTHVDTVFSPAVITEMLYKAAMHVLTQQVAEAAFAPTTAASQSAMATLLANVDAVSTRCHVDRQRLLETLRKFCEQRHYVYIQYLLLETPEQRAALLWSTCHKLSQFPAYMRSAPPSSVHTFTITKLAGDLSACLEAYERDSAASPPVDIPVGIGGSVRVPPLSETERSHLRAAIVACLFVSAFVMKNYNAMLLLLSGIPTDMRGFIGHITELLLAHSTDALEDILQSAEKIQSATISVEASVNSLGSPKMLERDSSNREKAAPKKDKEEREAEKVFLLMLLHLLLVDNLMASLGRLEASTTLKKSLLQWYEHLLRVFKHGHVPHGFLAGLGLPDTTAVTGPGSLTAAAAVLAHLPHHAPTSRPTFHQAMAFLTEQMKGMRVWNEPHFSSLWEFLATSQTTKTFITTYLLHTESADTEPRPIQSEEPPKRRGSMTSKGKRK